MARPSKKNQKNISESQTIVSKKVVAPAKKPVETKAVFPELKEPVSVIVPTAEKKPEPVKEVAKSSEEFLEDFPKMEPEDNKPVPVQVVKTEAPQIIKEEKIISKPVEYPPSLVPMINKLRTTPGFSRLRTASLLSVASAKLRSRHFFK